MNTATPAPRHGHDFPPQNNWWGGRPRPRPAPWPASGGRVRRSQSRHSRRLPLLLFVLLPTLALHAEIIDRIAASVGNRYLIEDDFDVLDSFTSLMEFMQHGLAAE